jgi:hypothetical protein
MGIHSRYLLAGASALFALALVLLHPDSASAHGGVSYERDMCVMKIGPYKMHFTGYEPETKQSQEFCEDIPDAGKSIIVLDQVEKVMKRMSMDFRVVRDDKNLGVNAQYEQLGGPKDIEASSIFYKKPEVYEHGTVTFDFMFDKGAYIGIVKLSDPETKQEFVSVFPFSVGFGPARQTRNLIFEVVGALVVGGVIIYFTNARQKGKGKPASEKAA